MLGASASSAHTPSPTHNNPARGAHQKRQSSATPCRVADDRPLIDESLGRSGLAVAGAAADARKTSDTTRHAARPPELAAGTAADARDAALPTGTAARAGELAAGAAVAVGVATASAWVLLED